MIVNIYKRHKIGNISKLKQGTLLEKVSHKDNKLNINQTQEFIL